MILFWLFVSLALMWPLIKMGFSIWLALIGIMGLLYMFRGYLKLMYWQEKRRLERAARQGYTIMSPGMSPVQKPIQKDFPEVVLVERNGVFVPANGEW